MSIDNYENDKLPSTSFLNRKVTIAVVDDHDLIREKISEILADMGFTVTIKACNGAALLEQLQHTELPDACLMDISMPVMNGFETAAQLRQQYPGIKILAFSADNDEHTVNKVLGCGAHGFAAKNIDPIVLRNKLIEIL